MKALRRLPRLLCLCLATVFLAAALQPAAQAAGPSKQRISVIAPLLKAAPAGFGRPIDDRKAWNALGRHEEYIKNIAEAEKLLTTPSPEQPDDLFLDFTRNGNRTRWQKVAGKRRGRLTTFVLAECVENKGRFLPAIESVVRELCAERTWVMPAHDSKLENFHGKQIDIDLGSSALGWQMATARYVLGAKLSDKTRQLMEDNVRRRILDPYRDMANGKRKYNWWMKTTNNWNAVCLAGVTGSALALEPSREERAFFVAAAEEYSKSFLRGFTSDGYCSEGLGYWNYGFGHYLMLSEEIYQATGGQIDLMAREEVKPPAMFGARIEIANGVYPAFADCAVSTQPSPLIMYFVSRRYRLGLTRWEQIDPVSMKGNLSQALMYSFPNSASQTPLAAKPSLEVGERSWFDKAGIMICRPGDNAACRLAVALKGGHNAEHHNHNDVGSYVVALGSQALLLDPGAEVYTARTFGKDRYVSKVLNSYGHPVPVVAGQLQPAGKEAKTRVVETELKNDADRLVLDLSAAYSVPTLKKLQRTFVYSRSNAGALTVTDEVEFEQPESFGTAVVTLDDWKQLDDGSLLVYDFEEAVRVTIDCQGAAYDFVPEEIENPGKASPTRLGINLKQPTTKAVISVTITPLAFPENKRSKQLLRNGGFEYGSWGWHVPQDSMGVLSAEQAADGKHSLKIVDETKQRGSSITSARMAVTDAGSLEVRGKVFQISGHGVGIYVRFLDENGKLLNQTDGKGGMQAVTSAKGTVGKWATFSKKFAAPKGTAFLQVWIHSANAGVAAVYLDELEVVRR